MVWEVQRVLARRIRLVHVNHPVLGFIVVMQKGIGLFRVERRGGRLGGPTGGKYQAANEGADTGTFTHIR